MVKYLLQYKKSFKRNNYLSGSTGNYYTVTLSNIRPTELFQVFDNCANLALRKFSFFMFQKSQNSYQLVKNRLPHSYENRDRTQTLNLQRRSSSSLVTRRTSCSSNISCVTWLS